MNGQRGGQSVICLDGWMDGQTAFWTVRHKDRRTIGKKDGWLDGYMDRYTDRPIEPEKDTQTEEYIGSQAYRRR